MEGGILIQAFFCTCVLFFTYPYFCTSLIIFKLYFIYHCMWAYVCVCVFMVCSMACLQRDQRVLSFPPRFPEFWLPGLQGKCFSALSYFPAQPLCLSPLKTHLKELHHLWDLLWELTQEKSDVLLQALKFYQYSQDCEDILEWIKEKVMACILLGVLMALSKHSTVTLYSVIGSLE